MNPQEQSPRKHIKTALTTTLILFGGALVTEAVASQNSNQGQKLSHSNTPEVAIHQTATPLPPFTPTPEAALSATPTPEMAGTAFAPAPTVEAKRPALAKEDFTYLTIPESYQVIANNMNVEADPNLQQSVAEMDNAAVRVVMDGKDEGPIWYTTAIYDSSNPAGGQVGEINTLYQITEGQPTLLSLTTHVDENGNFFLGQTGQTINILSPEVLKRNGEKFFKVPEDGHGGWGKGQWISTEGDSMVENTYTNFNAEGNVEYELKCLSNGDCSMTMNVPGANRIGLDDDSDVSSQP